MKTIEEIKAEKFALLEALQAEIGYTLAEMKFIKDHIFTNRLISEMESLIETGKVKSGIFASYVSKIKAAKQNKKLTGKYGDIDMRVIDNAVDFIAGETTASAIIKRFGS